MAFVVRLGVERLVAAGVPEPLRIRATGGGAPSATWMRVLAAVLQRQVIAAPAAEPALGAALIAAAAARGGLVGALEPDPTTHDEEVAYDAEPRLRTQLAHAYRRFLGLVAAAERSR